MPKRKRDAERDADQPTLAACFGTAVPAGPTANVTGNDHATSNVYMAPVTNNNTTNNSHNTTNNTTNNYNTTVERPLRTPPAYRVGAGWFTKEKAAKYRDPIPEHTLLWEEYKEAAQEVQRVEEGKDEYTVRGSELAGRDCNVRGSIAQRVVRRWDEMVNGYETKDGKADDKRVDGANLGVHQTKEDYLRRPKGKGGKWERVEVKSSRASWSTSESRWVAMWHHIKEENHDVLIRVLETPQAFEVFKHGGKKIGSNGKSTEKCGGKIVVYGASGTTDLEEACDQMCWKLVDPNGKEKCTPLDTIYINDPEYADCYSLTNGEKVYEGAPLSTLQVEPKGNVLQELCRLVGADKYGWETSKAKRGERSDGRTRGENTTPYDWATRDADPEKPMRRVEHKAGMMCWATSTKNWSVTFHAVKPALHDDLFLSFYTPLGVHIFKHDGRAGIGGKAQDHPNGNTLAFKAPVDDGNHDTLERVKRSAYNAERFILKRLAKWHQLPYLAFIKF